MGADDRIRVAVAGAAGRMGQEVVRAVSTCPDMELVVAVDRAATGQNLQEVVGTGAPDLVISDKLGAALDGTPADVLVDFTQSASAGLNAESALKRQVSPLIGTTGLDAVTLRELSRLSKELMVPGMYVPNFAIGAVLMMKFAEIAAKWLPDAEIIELHHDQKEDAPSGTSIRTAEMIAAARTGRPAHKPRPIMKVEGARGGAMLDVHIHSVRLKGFIAHQEVIFGGAGEVLTIRHDSMDRKSFMEGVKLCIREMRSLEGFVIGMDQILFREDG